MPVLAALSPGPAAARVRALQPYGLLDTPREERFDALVRLTARSCGTPSAVLGLADARRLWVKSSVGSPLPELPLEQAFCAHTLQEPSGQLVVPDPLLDSRFAGLPLVRDGLRFYAGRVLRDPKGAPLGTLCVFDVEPRPGLTPEQDDALRTLATAVEAQLELGRLAAGRAVPLDRQRELRRALERGELVSHLQPLWGVTPTAEGAEVRLVGAEALVRWEHPERGLLLPGAFLPDLEECGLSSALGELVLRGALRTLARWEAEGRLDAEFRMHVNVGAAQLHEAGLADLLRRLAVETGGPLHRLCVEITETALLDTAAFPPQAARELVDLGVRLVLDDFGTGYSSLTLLRRYPLAGVKVDRSFVQGLGTDREDEVIVHAVVGMAHELGLEAVCEGVETLEQLHHVLRTGAASVQGFLLGRASRAGLWEERLLPAAKASPECAAS